MNYSNLPLDTHDLVCMLKARGLQFTDEQRAEEQLLSVSYFKLAGYLRPFETDVVTHQYAAGTSYESAMELCVFDRELRALIFRAMQDVEVALRGRMIHFFSLSLGAFWFKEDALAKDRDIYFKNLQKMWSELSRSKEDFVKDHFDRYDCPMLPPAWKTMELLSFGTLSKLFENVKDTGVKKAVAKSLGLPKYTYLESWVKCATVLRNACCHHARVWNRRFAWKPQLPDRLPLNWIANASAIRPQKLYAQLCYLAYLEQSINPNGDFVGELKALLLKFPQVDVAAMGFPSGWDEEPLWQRLCTRLSISDKTAGCSARHVQGLEERETAADDAKHKGGTDSDKGVASDEEVSEKTDAEAVESSEAEVVSKTKVDSEVVTLAEDAGSKASEKE